MKRGFKNQIILIVVTILCLGCEEDGDIRSVSTGHLSIAGEFVFPRSRQEKKTLVQWRFGM